MNSWWGLLLMHPHKASGQMVLTQAFIKKNWDMIGGDIFQNCVQWIENLNCLASLNNTNVELIPKCQNLTFMKELRPIALSNMLYKIISKVLANRLNVLLPKIISQNQSTFVSDRSILDNMLLAYELIHYMRRKMRGKKGRCCTKIDISKAYDRSLRARIPGNWVNVLSKC